MTDSETLSMIRLFVAEQAGGDAIWCIAPLSAPEAYMQQELRRLHRIIETGEYETPAHLDM